jgi:small conductance mechanosensitive channel
MLTMQRMIAQVTPAQIDELIDTTGVTNWDYVWAAISIVVAAIIGRLVGIAIRRYGARVELPQNVIDLIGTVTRWFVIAIGIVVALTFMGLNAAPLWILVVLIAIVIVVSGRPLIEAFGAGLVLQARVPFKIGDLVLVGSELGIVKEVNSRVVILDTIDGRRVFVPNVTVLSEPIVNYTHRKLRMSEVALDVTYATDLDEACRVAASSLDGLDPVLPRPAPFAEVTEFFDSHIRIALRFWHASDLLSEWSAIDAAARAAHRAFGVHGIEFAFPQRTLWWGEPDAGSSEPPDTASG